MCCIGHKIEECRKRLYYNKQCSHCFKFGQLSARCKKNLLKIISYQIQDANKLYRPARRYNYNMPCYDENWIIHAGISTIWTCTKWLNVSCRRYLSRYYTRRVAENNYKEKARIYSVNPEAASSWKTMKKKIFSMLMNWMNK